MRWMIVPFVTAMVAFPTAPVGAADPGSDPKQLEGRWVVAHRAYTPSKANDRVAQLLIGLGQQVVIEDGKLAPADLKKGDSYFVVRFYSSAKPKAVDLKLSHPKDTVLLGIYSLEKDILTLNVSTREKRPTKFGVQEDQVVLVLKRIPKKGPRAGGPVPH